jgi:UDPglucose 6-dehydrogenase
MKVNENQKTRLLARIREYFKGNLKGKILAVWGLSFKPHTDDIREAPALYNIETFLKEGAIVHVHDPEAMGNVKQIFGDKLKYFDTAYDAAENADAIFIATEWPEFRTPDFEKLADVFKAKVIFDGRNVYELDMMKEQGFTYYSIGREVVNG